MTVGAFRKTLVGLFVVAVVSMALPVLAQTAADMAALEARLMARLELRLAEATEELRSEQEAQRLAFEQAVRTLASSPNALDRRAIVAIDAGNVQSGLTVLEERARARDAQATAANQSDRASEWKRIGALAFLDNTARATEAYERALQFAPDDVETLDQLAWLYGRQVRNVERAAVAERLTRSSSPEAQVKGFIHLADIHIDGQEGRLALAPAQRAVEIASENQLLRDHAMALAFLAGAQISARDYDAAEESVELSLAISRANGFRYEEGIALYMRASSSLVRGVSSLFGRERHFRRSDEVMAQIQVIANELQDPVGSAQLLVSRGRIALLLEDYGLAESRLRQAITDLERLGVRSRLGFAQQLLGTALAKQGRFDEAVPLFRLSVESARASNLPAYEAQALMEWAAAEGQRGNRPEACRLSRQSQDAYRRASGQGSTAISIITSLYCSN